MGRNPTSFQHYDKSIARFISEDPIGLGGGVNQYTYANSDPINARDPSGLCVTDSESGACIGLGSKNQSLSAQDSETACFSQHFCSRCRLRAGGTLEARVRFLTVSYRNRDSNKCKWDHLESTTALRDALQSNHLHKGRRTLRFYAGSGDQCGPSSIACNARLGLDGSLRFHMHTLSLD